MQNTKLTKLKRPALILGEVIMLVGITLFAVFPFSCKVSTSGIEVIGSDYTVPALDGFSVESSTTLVLSFSDDVKLLTAAVSEFEDGITDSIAHSTIEELSPALKSASAAGKEIPVTISYGADKKTVTVNLLESTKVGQKYIFYGEVENKSGSSLTFTLSFTGYNSKIPHLVLNEIHTNVSNSSTYKGATEYVEFYSLSDGNLAGLVVKSADDDNNNCFMFPSVNIKKGDFVVVHILPSAEDTDISKCISETTGNKTLSKEIGSSDNAWDFWYDGTDDWLGGTQDVITLENLNSGKILQALIFTKNTKTSWTYDYLSKAARRAVEDKIWDGSDDVSDAYNYTDANAYGIERKNLSEIIEDYENGKISYPFPSNGYEWRRLTNSTLSPGKFSK